VIDARDFLAQAERWIQETDEAHWRSAVSRAYYAAFHVARDLFRDLGFQVPRAGIAHAYLSMRLSNSGDITIQAAGSDLNRLLTGRNQADYDIHRMLTQPDALQLVRLARRIIQRLDTCRVDPLRTQVRDAMRDYERNVLRDVTWQGP
jgi:uncharacterized protein (UPF0332 family)